MNVRAAIIHLLGDSIQSIGVIIAAIIVYYKPEYQIADPICTFIFAFLTLLTTIPVFNDCLFILMESSPKEIDMGECFKDIASVDQVEDIHDFHVWTLTPGKMVMSAHVRSQEPELATQLITNLMKQKYGIFHITI